MRILLVEDDAMVGASLAGSLTDDGYAVDWVQDGRSAQHSQELADYALVLLDLGLPTIDGVALLRHWRSAGIVTPVIVITARDALDSRIDLLDIGADDYLVKPFDTQELAARMRAVLRRRSGEAESVLTHGDLRLDLRRHCAHLGPVQLELPRREFAVLRALMSSPGAVLSRSQLEEQVYGWGHEVESNAIEYAISRIRSKLGAGIIHNVRGVGWRLGDGEPS